MDTFYTLFGFGLFVAVYMTPTWVAWARHHQVMMVAVLNFFLGWTLIGWVVALAIAFGDRSKSRGVPVGS